MRRPERNDALARSLRAALDEARPGEAAEHPSEAQVARYLRREMADDEAERLEAHAAACGACADELALAARIEDEARTAADAGTDAGAAARRAASGAGAARAAGLERATPRRRGRTWLRVAAGLVLVAGSLVAALAGSELLLARLEPLVYERVAGLLGREVTSEGSSLVLAGGPGLRIEGLTIADDPAFGDGAFVRVAGTTLRLDPGALLRGNVRGDVHLDAPTVRLARDERGRWNVATLAGGGTIAATDDAARAARDARDGAPAAASRVQEERAVRLTSASVAGATLAIDDATADGGELVLRDVAGRYASPDPQAASTIALRGRIGGDGSFAVTGEVGPFEGAARPSYRFAEFAVQRLPLADVPGAPADVRGELTFRGSLATAGSGVDALVMNASGAGDLGVCCGELRERNLTRALVTALAREAAASSPADASELVARAAQEAPALASALAAQATPFEDIAGAVRVANGTLSFDDLVLDTALFQGIASGSLARSGALDAHGTVTLAAAATDAVVEVFPEARRLFGAGAELVVPFTVAGTWPDVTVQVDTRSAIARLLREHDPRALTLARALFG